MKLLLDENLSDRLVPLLETLYPGSLHVKTVGLIHSDDELLWQYAATNGFMIVSKDADFYQRSVLRGHPPKFVYLRVGNCPSRRILDLLEGKHSTIVFFFHDTERSLLILE